MKGHRSGQVTARLRPGADTDAKCRHLLGQLKSHATKQIFNKLKWPGPRRRSLCGVIVQGLLLKIPRPFLFLLPARHRRDEIQDPATGSGHSFFPNFQKPGKALVHFWCTFGANSAKSAQVTGALSVHFWCKQRQKCTSQWCTFGALSVHFEQLMHFRCTFGAVWL